jgi:hypothetical protein
MRDLEKTLIAPVCGIIAFVTAFVICGLWGGVEAGFWFGRGFGLLGPISGLTRVKLAS